VVVVVIVAVTVIAMIMIAAAVAITVMVPFVTMLDAAVRTFPVAVIEPLPIVPRTDPASAFIGRAAPVAFMPAIMSACGIPIAADPDEFRSGLLWNHGDDTRFGWSADADANRDLSVSGSADKEQRAQQRNLNNKFHFLIISRQRVIAYGVESRCFYSKLEGVASADEFRLG
jgi:hypothetical protein